MTRPDAPWPDPDTTAEIPLHRHRRRRPRREPLWVATVRTGWLNLVAGAMFAVGLVSVFATLAWLI